jgi:hypothetical protein
VLAVGARIDHGAAACPLIHDDVDVVINGTGFKALDHVTTKPLRVIVRLLDFQTEPAA